MSDDRCMIQPSDITVVILAGGRGTRLSSVVADRPKPLAGVAGRPFIEYLFDQVLRAGIEKLVIASGYLGEYISNHFGSVYKTLKLQYSKESLPLGTAGALRYALPSVETRYLLVLNGDSFCEVDLTALAECHRKKDARITLTAVTVPDVSRYGSVCMNRDGLVTEFIEKGAQSGTGYINAGVYLLDKSVIADLEPNIPCSLEKDVLPKYCNNGMYAFKAIGIFIDIGIPDDYARAQQIFTRRHGGIGNP